MSRRGLTGRGPLDIRYLYDDLNELRCAYQSPTALEDCPAGATTYTCDDAGNLTGSSAGLQIVYDAKGHTRSLTPAGGGQPIALDGAEDQSERTQRGSTSFTHNQLGLSLQHESDETLALTRDNRGAPLGQRSDEGAERFYHLTDALGSIVAVTDAAGEVKSRYAYDPYGQARADRTSEDPGVASVLRFQGQLLDRQSGPSGAG